MKFMYDVGNNCVKKTNSMDFININLTINSIKFYNLNSLLRNRFYFLLVFTFTPSLSQGSTNVEG